MRASHTETGVAVVGGGATGCGVARDLAMRGVDVTLLERERLGAGTSGRSHGLLHSGARYALQSPASAGDCLRENRVLRRIAPHCLDATGGVLVATADDDREHADERIAACRDVGIPVDRPGDGDVVTPPGLADDAEVVAAVPDAVVTPTLLVAATALDAVDRGASVVTGAAATDVAPADGRPTVTVDDGDGTVTADHVVLAAGAWTERLAATAGVDVPMAPTAGTMVTVDHPDLGVVLNRTRPPSDGDIVVPHPGTAVIGTTSEPVEDPDAGNGNAPAPTDDRVRGVVEKCAAMVPALRDAPIRRVYRGVRPLYSPNQAEPDRAISRDAAVLRHGDRDGVPGLTSVVGGKLTTHRAMAERAADAVCDALGVDAACRTAEEPLPGADGDVDRVTRFAGERCADAPADADVAGL